MGLARAVEERLEGMMEGFFARVFRSGLQPVEVGRRIQREMGENKTISVSRTYAPNDFRIFIGPEDRARFQPMEEGLVSEFSEVVIETAKQNRWNLMGQPRVRFIEDEDLGKGQFKVESSLTADKGSPAPAVSTREPDEANPGATRAISLNTAERLGLSKSGAQLVVLDDSGQAKESISITRTPIVVGRLSSVDVVLSDPNVSRRHAELRRDGPAWVIVDLGSTNGTYVNGKQVTEQALSDGDRLSFGSSDLLIKLAGPADRDATQMRPV
jgi:pSer/pThr/pTyr-binding forkhead associated (FHA) protein